MHFGLDPAAVHWCLLISHLYEEQICVILIAVQQDWCMSLGCCRLELEPEYVHQ